MSPDRVLHKFKLLHQKVNSMDRRVLAALVEEVKTAKVALRGGGRWSTRRRRGKDQLARRGGWSNWRRGGGETGSRYVVSY